MDFWGAGNRETEVSTTAVSVWDTFSFGVEVASG
jgi:hypothetical protein